MRAGLAEFHVRHLLLQRTASARARLPRLPGKAERRGSGLHLYRTRAEPDHRETQLALRTPVRIADCGAANPGRSRLLGGQSRLKAGCGQNCPAAIYIAEGARNADAVIHTALAAAADTGQVDRAAVKAIVGALSQFNRPFIYTSGCWVVGDTGDKVADEDTPLAPTPLVAWRPANEQLVLAATLS